TPVIVTTTTHLGTEQGALADIHFTLADDAPFPDLEKAISENQVVLLTGEPHAGERLGSIPSRMLAQLKIFVEEKNIPLLIEADGSRKLPIKAPAEKEPVIPGWVNAVVVVVGLSSVGEPATMETIHRFAHFSKITGIKAGEAVLFEHIEKLLTHPLGGLKGIPEDARRMVLLNQADDETLTREAASLADRLVGLYDVVLTASLKPAGRVEGGVSGVKRCAERIAGIILAAGGASRYGRPKSLLAWQGETLIRRIVKTALAAGLDPVVVVLGAATAAIRAELAGLPVQFVENPMWEQGQSSSLRTGIEVVSAGICGGAIMLQADQPRVPVELLQREIEHHAGDPVSIVIPRVDGHPSSPVLFDRRYFDDLLAIKGDQGGRALFEKYPKQWLDWNDPTDLMDIDTPEDYQRLLETGG
ncbi:MAG: selenium cofactor biosynthesis protein YqeC, partial [Anaerolineaceae bacterium]|nr:selenium cofactor biosynthesis protein YqeC [Anaerolineaceae bacterium]